MSTVSLALLYNYAQQSLSTSSLYSFVQKFNTAWQERRQSASVLYMGRLNSTLAAPAPEFFSSSNTTNTVINHSPVTTHYVPPRNPIVLCHGLFGFDIWEPNLLPAIQMRYWNVVEDALAKMGAKVIVASVPRADNIWNRAQFLHTALKRILRDNRLNFVAYSMGGLDCRYLLSHIKDRPYHVQSLTTIAAPHQGSPVMDWFRDNVGLAQQHALAAEPITPLVSDTSVMSTDPQQPSGSMLQKSISHLFDEPAYSNLTTDFCRNHFNPNTPDDPSVRYYSYGASTKIPAWSNILGPTWRLVQRTEGDNDGIVSLQSARWGEYIKTIPADHWDLCGKGCVQYRWRTDPASANFDRAEFYVELASMLYHKGH